MRRVPQGRKSQVEVLPGGRSVRKTYNENGNPAEKYLREIGFYVHYSDSPLIPKLIDSEPEKHITIELAAGERLADRLPLPREEMESLSDDYCKCLVELFSCANPLDTKHKQYYYDGRGADENLTLLAEALDRLCDQYHKHPILNDLRDSVAKVDAGEELLIKLDWNPENVFLLDNRIEKFIDFEQAFVGTRPVLVGVLLHSSDWPASRLFCSLKEAGLFEPAPSELRHYLCYSFATVLVDSIGRRGSIWELERLERAFERHVLGRYREAVAGL